MSKRINIVLPEATIQTIDRIRSRFIDRAVQHFVSHRSKEALRTQLECATVRDRDLDSEIAVDWFHVDTKELKEPDTRSAAKSTSRRSIRR
jgi:hypothetical protein